VHLLEKIVGEKGCFGRYNLLGILGTDAREDPSCMCHNHTANTFLRAILKDKDRAAWVQGRAVLGEVS
jgi:hypothetical protein